MEESMTHGMTYHSQREKERAEGWEKTRQLVLKIVEREKEMRAKRKSIKAVHVGSCAVQYRKVQ